MGCAGGSDPSQSVNSFHSTYCSGQNRARNTRFMVDTAGQWMYPNRVGTEMSCACLILSEMCQRKEERDANPECPFFSLETPRMGNNVKERGKVLRKLRILIMVLGNFLAS